MWVYYEVNLCLTLRRLQACSYVCHITRKKITSQSVEGTLLGQYDGFLVLLDQVKSSVSIVGTILAGYTNKETP